MKSKLTMMVAMAAACAAIQLAAMPTEEEARRAEPVVKKLLAGERAALESGRKTRSEVADAAMKLADETDTDAAKLLLMKGAFVLYVRDGKLEKAVETMKALKAAIADMPPQSVTNMIEMALLGVAKNEDGVRLYKLLDESKADIASIGASSMVVKERNSIASILKGLIKVPGRDLWLSETELTQGQWEAVMGNNPSLHKGVNLPVENISRDECDIFLEKLNQTKEVQASQFEFCLPGRAEWAGVARAGNPDLIPWIKPGVAGELLDMAWLKENSDGETHAVATKVPNAFGFYDMVGNVHEWVIEAPETRGTKRGYSFANSLSQCRPGRFSRHERNKRFADTGLRLAAHVRPQPALMTSGATGKTEVAARKSEAERVGVPTQKMSVTAKSESDESKKNEMKLPYEVVDGAVVLRSRGLQSRRIRRDDQKSAVVKISSGELVIPDAIDGIPVRSIGYGAFSDCKGLTAVTIPSSVTNIYDIAFSRCSGIKSFSVASDNPSYSSRNGLLCTKDGATLVAGVIGVNGNVAIPNSVTTIGRAAFSGRSGLKNVTIPSSVTGIVANAFSGCNGITSFSVDTSNASYSSRNGMLWTKDGATLVAGVVGVNGNVTIPEGVVSIGSLAFSGHSGLKSVTIPNGVTNIGNWAFHGCSGLTSVAIPEGVTSIGAGAFLDCRGLTSVTIPNSVTSIGVGAFCTCSALKSVTMCGERPNVPNSLLPNNIFGNCGKLKSIHVPANAKSWAGIKEWQGIPLVFDGVDAAARSSADTNGVYCVIDISGGSNAERYPVSYLDSVPEGGWGDEYKTTKIVLRRVDAGTYPMLGNRKVTFTKPFYIGIFELTQKQIKLLSGDNNRKFVFEGDMRPADCLTWEEMRGKNEEFDYPKTKEVAPGSIIGKLRAKTGLFQIDLPTSYQFGCAWNAGTDGSGRDARSTGRHFSNQRDGKGGYTSEHTIVGSYLPNEWGIYDLHGNVWEMCLDYCGKLDAEDENDPEGPVEGAKRQLRGGGWHSTDRFVFSDYVPQTGKLGCRIVINVEARTEQRRQLEAIKEELRKAREESKVHEVFSLNAAPGSITELNLGDVPPLQFVYCPAGKFSMGYKEQPAISKMKDVEITSPFWVSKTPIRVDQLASLGINSITDARIGAAGIDDASIVVQELPSVLKARFGKMLPPGYVFRLPTEAEFEYLQKAETKDKNAQTNIWGVERLYAGGYIGLLDRAPEYGKGVDVVNRWHDAMAWTDLVKVNYENQPDKDPVGWSDNPNWSVFRRGLARDCGGGKLITTQCNSNLYGFYFVVAPDVDKLNKFYWK